MNIWFDHMRGRRGGTLIFHWRKLECAQESRDIARVYECVSENPGLSLANHTLGMAAVGEIRRQVEERRGMLARRGLAVDRVEANYWIGEQDVVLITGTTYDEFLREYPPTRSGVDWFVTRNEADERILCSRNSGGLMAPTDRLITYTVQLQADCETTFDVEIQRTEYREHTFRVEASDRAMAEELARDMVGDYNFLNSPVSSATEEVTSARLVVVESDDKRGEERVCSIEDGKGQ